MSLKTKEELYQYSERISKAAAYIHDKSGTDPDVLLILGSGLGAMAEAVQNAVRIPYSEIPGFPGTTVEGHAGMLVTGLWQGKKVAVMQGRFHYYEGHSPEDIVLPVRVMQKLDVKNVLLTNAAGGLREEMIPGDLMLIRDHLGLFAESPLRGLNLDQFGPRFPDQSKIYDIKLAETAISVAQKAEIKLIQGIYCYSKGPQFETPAEIKALRSLGASAVGMSTVPEAIAAAHGGQKVMAISCITNMAAGILDQPLSHDEVIKTGARVADKTIRLLSGILQGIDD